MNEDLKELMECVAMIAAIGFSIEPEDAERALPDILRTCAELESYQKMASIVDAGKS